jgi:1-aminocyclopropane-1-carboxylate deaminase/D-cysteine desulfhydrase-like pyridoxal-dependent ACC family enzyme
MIINGADLDYRGSILSAGLHYYLHQLIPGRSYFLPPGGSNIMGCVGFVNAAFELKQQIENGVLPEPDRIICPVGSSSTLAGLALGCQLAGLKCKVEGIRVAPAYLGILPICTAKTVSRLMKRTYRYLRRASDEVPLIQLRAINLNDGHFGRGYGHATDEGDAAMELFKRRGIVLESTYTAKTAAAVLQACQRNPEETILYWHTFNSADVDVQFGGQNIDALPKELQMIVQC